MSDILITGGRVLDPATGSDQRADVLVRDGRIATVAPELIGPGAERIDAGGLVVTPGFVDLHTHLRDPGFEYKETIATGTLAAARGGFTTVCCMPNTEPAIDSRATVEYLLRRAELESLIRVIPIGCITRGRAGKELAEFGELAAAGVCAVSDDGSPVGDASLMRHALEYSRAFDLTVIEHAEDLTLVRGGVIHEGWVSTRLGLHGVPTAAEEAAVQRDISLAELTGARLHFAHVSTAGSVEMVRRAKAAGLRVSAEATPHHLTLTHEAVLGSGGVDGYDTNARVNPPLRTRDDVEACIEGLLDGTIEAIATDHAPHAVTDKLVEFDLAANGISGLETAFGAVMSLVHSGRLTLSQLLHLLSRGPARLLRLDERAGLQGLGTLSPGAPADLVLLDPDLEWTVDPEQFASKGKNTPLRGHRLTGAVVATVAAGSVAWHARSGDRA